MPAYDADDGEARVKPGSSKQCQADKLASEMKRIGQVALTDFLPPASPHPLIKALKQRGIDTALTNTKLATDFAANTPKLHVPKLKLNLAGRNINGTKKDSRPPPADEPQGPPKNLVEKLDRFLLLDMESGGGRVVPEPRPYFGPSSTAPSEQGLGASNIGDFGTAATGTGLLAGVPWGRLQDSASTATLGDQQPLASVTAPGPTASLGREREERQPYQRQPRPPHLTLVFPLDLSPFLPPEVADITSLREPETWEQAGSIAAATLAAAGVAVAVAAAPEASTPAASDANMATPPAAVGQGQGDSIPGQGPRTQAGGSGEGEAQKEGAAPAAEVAEPAPSQPPRRKQVKIVTTSEDDQHSGS